MSIYLVTSYPSSSSKYQTCFGRDPLRGSICPHLAWRAAVWPTSTICIFERNRYTVVKAFIQFYSQDTALLADTPGVWPCNDPSRSLSTVSKKLHLTKRTYLKNICLIFFHWLSPFLDWTKSLRHNCIKKKGISHDFNTRSRRSLSRSIHHSTVN